jgi:hypothetical protein
VSFDKLRRLGRLTLARKARRDAKLIGHTCPDVELTRVLAGCGALMDQPSFVHLAVSGAGRREEGPAGESDREPARFERLPLYRPNSPSLRRGSRVDGDE